MKKIAIAGPVGSLGGLQTHYAELKRFLASEGYEILAVDVPQPGAQLANPDLVRVAQVVAIGGSTGSRNPRLGAAQWFGAVRTLRNFRPDMLVSVANGYGYALLGALAPHSCFTIRTEVTDSWRSPDALHEVIARAYDATAVQSPRLLNAQRTKISAKHNIAVLPCFAGIDVGEELSIMPRPSESLRLAFFGRLAPNKGLVELVQAVSAGGLPERATVDIWGAGPMADVIKDLITEVAVADRIRLRGLYPSGREFPKVLASYHGLVLPSQFSEGLPLILLEAASVGLPFLSCDVGAISDCTLGNPDATVIPVGVEQLKLGLKEWSSRLAKGEFSPHRLKVWYEANHSRTAHERVWRQMLSEPVAYFKKA